MFPFSGADVSVTEYFPLEQTRIQFLFARGKMDKHA
jgi:hypothetical protein